LRSTPLEVAPGEGPLPSYSDYSSSPFPQWPVPTWNCLPDGGRLVQKQGDTLKYWRILPTVKAVVADNCERDIETAHSLVTGLGLPDYDVRIEESLFNPFPSVCEYQLPLHVVTSIHSSCFQVLSQVWIFMPLRCKRVRCPCCRRPTGSS